MLYLATGDTDNGVPGLAQEFKSSS